MQVTGTEREEHPRIFTAIHLEYIVRGENISPADVECAIDLSTTKYCSVSAMLKPTVQITHSFRIEPSCATEVVPAAGS
jgi:putative redox protein